MKNDKTLADACNKIDILKCTGNLANILASRFGTFMGERGKETDSERDEKKESNLLRHVAQPNLALLDRMIYCLPPFRSSPFNPRFNVQPILTKISLLPLVASRKIIINFTPAFHFAGYRC